MTGIYFSGTGNTKFCVDKFLEEYNHSKESFSIEDNKTLEAIKSDNEIVIGYPVQYSNIPKILRDYIVHNRHIWKGKHIFIIATMGLFSGDGAGVLARLLKKYGAIIVGGLHLKMPDSICDVKALKRSFEENKEIVMKTEEKICKFVCNIKNGKPPQEGLGIADHLAGLFGQRLYFFWKTQKYTDKLKIDPLKCIGCGSCEKLCPMGNIAVKSGTAVSRDKMDRPITTLFMLMSVDGKISTGATDDLDVDKDFPKIMGVQEGLHQYYEIEQTTDLWSLNSGRVQEKIGINMKELPDKSPVSFVIIDNSHLTEHGIRYFCALSKEFVLITSNKDHPAFQIKEINLHIIYQSELSLADALTELKSEYGCQRITIQSGGTLNGLFLREKLFDYIDIVVAPVLIGGKDTSTLIDGESLLSKSELSQLGVLKLQECTVLEDSYIRLRYKVIH